MENTKDQWLSDGNCKQCRRAPYCKKPCKPCKEKFKDYMSRRVGQRVAEKTKTELVEEFFKEA